MTTWLHPDLLVCALRLHGYLAVRNEWGHIETLRDYWPGTPDMQALYPPWQAVWLLCKAGLLDNERIASP